jgi:DNA processing protein
MSASAPLPPGLLPPAAYAIGLAALPDVGPARLRLLLDGRDPEAAWRAVLAGRPGPASRAATGGAPERLAATWARAAATTDLAALWAAHTDAAVGVSLVGSPSYPPALTDDPEPPSVLFHVGDPSVLVGPLVAVVGTRDCTRYGHDLAFELGRDLAAAGVGVVSGLALGIDGAAHAGALAARSTDEPTAARPVAVVGSGLDVVYPARNRHLWEAVRHTGVLLGEHPLGTRPRPWHFPARNRVIAAVADVVVVVESHRGGGAMHTLDEALARDRPVMAVPGSVRSRASTGTNQALFDGVAEVCRDVDDVLGRLGLTGARPGAPPDRRVPPGQGDAAVLDAVGWQPASIEQVLLRTGLPLGATALALERLEAAGWLAQRGGWFERVAPS